MFIKMFFFLLILTLAVKTYFKSHIYNSKSKNYCSKTIKKKIIKVNANQSYILNMNTSFCIVPLQSEYANSQNIYGIKQNNKIQFFDYACNSIFMKNDSIKIINYFSNKEQLFYCFYR